MRPDFFKKISRYQFNSNFGPITKIFNTRSACLNRPADKFHEYSEKLNI